MLPATKSITPQLWFFLGFFYLVFLALSLWGVISSALNLQALATQQAGPDASPSTEECDRSTQIFSLVSGCLGLWVFVLVTVSIAKLWYSYWRLEWITKALLIASGISLLVYFAFNWYGVFLRFTLYPTDTTKQSLRIPDECQERFYENFEWYSEAMLAVNIFMMVAVAALIANRYCCCFFRDEEKEEEAGKSNKSQSSLAKQTSTVTQSKPFLKREEDENNHQVNLV